MDALATSPRLSRLTCLNLGFNSRFGDAGLRSLAASPHLINLTSLDIRSNIIGPANAQMLLALLASPHLARLTSLDLGGNELGEAGTRIGGVAGPGPPRFPKPWRDQHR